LAGAEVTSPSHGGHAHTCQWISRDDLLNSFAESLSAPLWVLRAPDSVPGT
jgi:hypothetical protein